MKTAIVHEWLLNFAGSEQVVKAIYELYPSPVYTLIQDRKSVMQSFLKDAEIHTSTLQRIPFAIKHYRKLLALFPRKIEEFDLSAYDLILSSSHSVAKGVLTNANQLHICYMHTPMRYSWDLYFRYLDEAGFRGLRRRYAQRVLHEIRKWDVVSANRVDEYIANSQYIAKRIRKVYRREATVIYPPVDVEEFQLKEHKDNYYLAASRMVPYKKLDLIVETFTRMPDKKLVVIGSGPQYNMIKRIAAGHSNIEVLGYQPTPILRSHMQNCKAFLFAAEEDFGIMPVEAQACGTPVIAFRKGGASETVIDGKTGIFFEQQSVESIRDAISRFEKIEDKFDGKELRRHAEGFSTARFKEEYRRFVEDKYTRFKEEIGR